MQYYFIRFFFFFLFLPYVVAVNTRSVLGIKQEQLKIPYRRTLLKICGM